MQSRSRRRATVAIFMAAMSGCAGSIAGRPPAVFGGVAGALVIAHRGGSLEAPENTLAALSHGIACGADWQEFDVHLTRDDEVVVIHDDTLDRTTNGHGRVEDTPLAVVRSLSAGAPRPAPTVAQALSLFGARAPDFGARWAAERVPTLDEALALQGGRFMIELKKTSHPVRLVEKVLAAIHRAGAEDRVALASFELDLLDLAYAREPSIPLVGIVEEERQLEPALERPVSVLAVRLDLIEAARQVAPPTVALWAWTAYSPAMAEAAVERGAHGVITDAPAAVLAALRTPPPPQIPLSR